MFLRAILVSRRHSTRLLVWFAGAFQGSTYSRSAHRRIALWSWAGTKVCGTTERMRFRLTGARNGRSAGRRASGWSGQGRWCCALRRNLHEAAFHIVLDVFASTFGTCRQNSTVLSRGMFDARITIPSCQRACDAVRGAR